MTKPVVKLDTNELRKLKRRLGSLSKLNVKVGMLQGKGAEKTAEDSPITMAELAAIHEFGAPKAGIPQRSFIRGAFKSTKAQKDMKIMYARVARLIFADTSGRVTDKDLERFLGFIGLWGVATIQEFIRKRISPPNKEATTEAKGSDLPLVDSGRMINALNWEVSKGGDE